MLPICVLPGRLESLMAVLVLQRRSQAGYARAAERSSLVGRETLAELIQGNRLAPPAQFDAVGKL